MSDHIDAAANARQALEDTQGFYWGDDPEAVTLRLLQAQAEATLALVEQQRIANIIAVATWNVEALRRGARKIGGEEVDIKAESARVDELFAEVREALRVR